MEMNGDVKMKNEQKIKNQWRVIRKIYNDGGMTFNWDDLRVAIESLINMERLKTDPHYLIWN